MNSPTSAKIASVPTAISRFGPVARQRDLLALGISTRQIRIAVQQGSVIQVARGHYAVPGVSTQDIYLARHQAQRTCLSKVSELGLWQLREPESVHVAAAHGRPIPGCVVHKHSGGQTLMGILRQCVACGTELEGLIILESAVVAKICTINDLQSEFTKRGDNAARALVETIDPQSMAITETAGRYHLKKAGHNVQGQAYIRDAGHLDLLVDGVLGIEADGKRFHDTENGWREDLRRDTMYVLRGVWRLRIPGEVVLYHPDVMMAWVSQALAMIRSTPRSR
ncbi:type IV toxin-antitoxin system AbiEi family antitoxin domain-containing protein [Arthrobacter sp. GMC3]|uniref:type IV toxin-antitoxin system AbiEi family antitoxin domain-containing protein n=1 Tax=Arthrobacter sp. GMC3 TaxID=2058894 RepID=UPI000CE45712|nr:type IV toxin-antitoxin system AbiEi family antitoxin domain-containing protein [Arthrobacter sp. GMC3]